MRRATFSCLLLVAAGLALTPLLGVADPSPSPVPSASPPVSRGDARPSTEAMKKELTAVIDAQLAAFRANDYVKAYTFAAAEIKTMYPAADFEKMVRGGFPLIAHCTTADYGIAFDTGEEAVVNVRIANADRQSIEYQYLLKKEDGVWKIGGVVPVKPEGLSV